MNMKRSFKNFLLKLNAVGLRKEVEARALEAHVSLRDLYEGVDQSPSIVAARREVYRWLVKSGKGYGEVARLFDRAPSGVWRLVNSGN